MIWIAFLSVLRDLNVSCIMMIRIWVIAPIIMRLAEMAVTVILLVKLIIIILKRRILFSSWILLPRNWICAPVIIFWHSYIWNFRPCLLRRPMNLPPSIVFTVIVSLVVIRCWRLAHGEKVAEIVHWGTDWGRWSGLSSCYNWSRLVDKCRLSNSLCKRTWLLPIWSSVLSILLLLSIILLQLLLCIVSTLSD